MDSVRDSPLLSRLPTVAVELDIEGALGESGVVSVGVVGVCSCSFGVPGVEERSLDPERCHANR